LNKKILVVDDDPDFRRAIYVRLHANHYETSFAGDGISAIAAAEKDRPDLILLDLGLPARDGLTVMQQLKAIPGLAGIPVVVMSAHDAHVYQERAIQAGAKAYLQKPVDNFALLAVIRQALQPE